MNTLTNIEIYMIVVFVIELMLCFYGMINAKTLGIPFKVWAALAVVFASALAYTLSPAFIHPNKF